MILLEEVGRKYTDKRGKVEDTQEMVWLNGYYSCGIDPCGKTYDTGTGELTIGLVVAQPG